MAPDWLFIQSVTAYHDGKTQPLEFGAFKRDSSSKIWEWKSVINDPVLLLQVEDLALAKEAILRFHGRLYTKDYTLSEADKKALREMLKAYRILKERA